MKTRAGRPRKWLLSLLMCLVMIMPWGSAFATAAITVTGDPYTKVSIVSYVVMEETLAGTIVTRKARLQIRNGDAVTAANISARLMPVSGNVSVADGTVAFGDMNPGETASSLDDFTVLIDTSQQDTATLNWIIEYDDTEGRHHTAKFDVTDDLSP